jgi:hypothetical protein
VDIVVAGIAVAAFAGTVFVVAFALSNLQRGKPRSVEDATGEGWMTVDEVADLLEVSPAEVVTLAERDAIPHYLVSAGSPSDPRDLRFRRSSRPGRSDSPGAYKEAGPPGDPCPRCEESEVGRLRS